MLAIIRIRGSVGTRTGIEQTLVQLGLKKNHACVVVPQTPTYAGYIQKIKDYVTWGAVSEDVVKKMLAAKKLKAVSGENPYKGVVFHLSSPKKGFKGSIKHPYPKGELGNRREKINELLERMI